MKHWDVFISHAREDTDKVVPPVFIPFEEAGLRVWLDEQELRLGDSIRERIDEEFAKSAYGVLIVSPQYLAKVWPKREFNALLALEEPGGKIILPAWHDITRHEVASHSGGPLLRQHQRGNSEGCASSC